MTPDRKAFLEAWEASRHEPMGEMRIRRDEHRFEIRVRRGRNWFQRFIVGESGFMTVAEAVAVPADEPLEKWTPIDESMPWTVGADR